MSKLYAELRDLAVNDATIYQHLKLQEATGASDWTVAITLIRQLAKEKKAYFDDAVDTRNRSIAPTMIAKS